MRPHFAITKFQGFTLLIFLCLLSLAFAFQGWERFPLQPAAGDLISLVPHPLRQGRLLAASRHEVLEETENGTWKNLRYSASGAGEIHRLMIFKEIPDSVFLLTKRGVFRFDLSTQKGGLIYRGKNLLEKSVLSMAVLPGDPNHLFLGTEGGLFESDDRGKNWYRMEYFSAREPVALVRIFHDRLFAATRKRLYISKDLDHFQPVFSLFSGDAGEFLEIEDEGFPNDSVEIGEPVSDFHELTGFPKNDVLWLATRKGVFESRDGGNSWRMLPQSGLQTSDISLLIHSGKSDSLFAGTSRGIYQYSFAKKHWEEIFEGLARPETKALTLFEGDREILAAVTPEGLMRYEILPEEIKAPDLRLPSPERTSLFTKLIRLEPAPEKLHKAVMRFSNLKNGKIKRWHTASHLAAFLPNLSFGRDFSKNNNVDIDRGGASDADKFILGPGDFRKSWSADVSWDLGDFIWSSNQTAIDNREKLMVELRNDFLAEATRIYFERRRLQMEIVFSPAPSEMEHYGQILRLEELTALLDGMSGGWMAKGLERTYRDHPELEKLWEYQDNKS